MKFIAFFAILSFLGCTNKNESVSAKPATVAPPLAQASVAPTAPPAQTAAAPKWRCDKGTDKRLVEVVKQEEGCILNYTQTGKTKREAKSKKGTQACETAASKTLSKLVKSGFNCNRV